MLWRLIKTLWRDKATAVLPRIADNAAEQESLHAWLRRGQALQEAGALNAALECYRACAAVHPHDLPTRIAVANVLSFAWRMEECISACAEALEVARGHPDVFSGLLLYSHYAAHPDHKALFELHRRYGELIAMTTSKHDGMSHVNAADPSRPLRIGYVSQDFRNHPVACFLEPVIAHHDRRRYRIYCYYAQAKSDEITQRFARSADEWRHVHADDADTLAARIKEDCIDILVDLGGHMKLNRLAAFARRPAPLQVTWLGYPDTTGLAAIDYRVTDDIADPAEADALHIERLLRLDPPFLCYQPPANSPPVVVTRDTKSIVFGSFNMLMKVNDPLIAMWARILAAVPGSRMLIKSKPLEHAETAARLVQRFEACGIEAGRLDLRSWTPTTTQHLSTYNETHVALDTFPYNGTTTTCEALWMGVPVVTRAGQVHMSRVGASILASVGLPELIAHSADEYVQIATTLALDSPRREALASEMRQKLSSSPLFDYPGFTRKLENGLRNAWVTRCATQRDRDLAD